MKRSESITNLAAALAQAQGQFKPALRSRENPHLHNMYATLDDIITAVREPLHKNGLSIVQPLTGDGEDYLLETILFHESGEWIGSETIVPVMEGNRAVNALQVFGSSLTYMRRYMLSAMLGINTGEDADGNGAAGKKKTTKKPARTRRAAKAPTPKTASENDKPPNALKALPPDEWDSIELPTEYAELWGDKMWQLIGYNSKQHALNALKPYDHKTAGEAWGFLLEHQVSKLPGNAPTKPTD